ncbi:hypothetical protein B0H13DRAFT_1885187 [Mycena leptocephala]|nr:hypothetical protein B0H13DRAFT_1885187 [Mycena leptocephala]
MFTRESHETHVKTVQAVYGLCPANIRFEAARQWEKHAQVHQPSSLICAYTTAIELLSELAWLGLSITDRHHHLLQAGRVVRDAASAVIAVHDYQKAVEWLDQGRSVIWGQLLSLRTPVDELRNSHPGLADQLVSLSTSLETVGTRSNAVADGIEPPSLQLIAQKSHAFALDRDHLLQQIRGEYGCDALIVLPGLADEVIHVPFPDFTIHNAQALAKILASIVGNPGRNDRLHGSREGDMAPDDIISYILSELWVKIVHLVLNALAITTPASQDLERIWWCPTGPLAFLPIHAAGLYGKDQAFGLKLSGFLISSYTPSLTALIQGYRPQPESQAGLQLLAVTQPSAEGQSYIPGTREEIKCIEQHAKGKSPPPTESALLLAGSSRLTLSNIIELPLPNAELAFLSACQTATGSQELPDESVHLTAGMLLAGYRGVIGTMWSIMDNDAPQVAGDVYAQVLEASV